MTQLYIVATEDAQAGFRLATSTPGVKVVPPESLLASGASRDVAASFFTPLADVLSVEFQTPLSSARPARLALPRHWPEALPLAAQRMLQRTALSLGAVLVAPRQDPTLDPDPRNAPQSPPRPPAGPFGWAPQGGFETLGWVNRGPGAGAYRPGAVALLVGERPGTARSGALRHRLPFVTFAGVGCAPWLAEQLESAEIPENALYWINAYDAINTPTAAAFLADLRPRVIVALGRLAARWCGDAGVRYEEAPHPQHWKRFRAREPYPLLSVLRRHLLRAEPLN